MIKINTDILCELVHVIKKSIRLYLHYISMNIRSMMQYKISFFLSAAGQFLISFSVFLGVFFMFQRFSSVEGFSYSEVLLCFSIFALSICLAEIFGRGFDAFSGMVRGGEFDRILVRPRNEILQVLGSKFELTRIGRMLQAVIMFIYGIAKSEVVWDFPKVLTVVFMLVGGTALFMALFIIYAAICFFTLEGLEVMNIFTDGAREFGRYPLGIYGKKVLLFTTFCILNCSPSSRQLKKYKIFPASRDYLLAVFMRLPNKFHVFP